MLMHIHEFLLKSGCIAKIDCKILRRRPRLNSKLYSLYNEPNISEDIKIRRLRWADHRIRMEEERIPKKGFKRKLLHHKTSGKTKNQMGECGPEGRITIAGDMRMEEKN